MSNNDQQLVDHLYSTIFVQLHRYNYFDVAKLANNSVWNKKTDEKYILDDLVNKYKKYYKDKAELLKLKLYDIKQLHINSYLTYDEDYYISQYNQRIEEVNRYISDIDTKTLDYITKNRLSYISESITEQFPSFLVDPTLLGKL